MTYAEWFNFFIAIQIIHFLGTWKLYLKADRKVWEAAIPIYNGVVLMNIIKRPKWWIVLLFIPIVNLLMFPVIWVEVIRTFGFYKRKDTLLVIVTFGFYIYYINYFKEAKHNPNRSLKPRSALGEWVSSITFAVVAATLVHTYFMQPFTIPTPSLEKSLLVGDFLFVSKFHYGARIPLTVVAAPMVHDSIPFTKRRSYLKRPQLPYMRLPGIEKIKNNDIVSFNWPADTLALMWGDNSGKFTYKPLDKKTNYVKRCIGIAGDSIQMKNGYFYINGKKNTLPDRAKLQFQHLVYSKNGLKNSKIKRYVNNFNRKFTVTFSSQNELNAFRRYRLERIEGNKFFVHTDQRGVDREIIKKYRTYIFEVIPKIRGLNLTEEEAEKLKKDSEVDSIIKITHKPSKEIFPHIKSLSWSQDNFGPIYIPKAGATVKLNLKTLPFYKQIIKNYENNDLQVVGENIYINQQKADSYTFRQDYYFMIGDNRHNSLDSRYWGYVPYDHVLGKPVMVWFSWDANSPTWGEKLKSIRWDRLFTTVGGDGEPISYKYLVFLLIVAYAGYEYFKNKKAKR